MEQEVNSSNLETRFLKPFGSGGSVWNLETLFSPSLPVHLARHNPVHFYPPGRRRLQAPRPSPAPGFPGVGTLSTASPRAPRLSSERGRGSRAVCAGRVCGARGKGAFLYFETVATLRQPWPARWGGLCKAALARCSGGPHPPRVGAGAPAARS